MGKANKKKVAPKDSKLRVLSIAYATARISREVYLKERTRLLGALEFEKPLPELPAELLNIVIPNIKIDASYVNAAKKISGRRNIIIIILILLLLGCIAGLWHNGFFATTEKPTSQVTQPNLSDHAEQLLHNSNWSERDIKMFLRLWATHSPSAHEKARHSMWYLKLDNDIIKRINQAQLRKRNISEEELPGLLRQLDLLRAFQAQISSN